MISLYISIYSIIVIMLILTRVYNVDRISLIVKTILSIILIISTITSPSSESMIMISIILSAIADIFLGIHRIEKKSTYLFYIALIIVTASQICMLISSIQLSKFNKYSIILAIIMNIILYYSFEKKCTMETMQKISMIYAYVFLLVVSNVILNASVLNTTYFVAVFLYWISDIVLFVNKFIAKKNEILFDGINKIMYYMAQLLFVLYIQK